MTTSMVLDLDRVEELAAKDAAEEPADGADASPVQAALPGLAQDEPLAEETDAAAERAPATLEDLYTALEHLVTCRDVLEMSKVMVKHHKAAFEAAEARVWRIQGRLRDQRLQARQEPPAEGADLEAGVDDPGEPGGDGEADTDPAAGR